MCSILEEQEVNFILCFLDAFASPEAEEVSPDGDPGEWWHCC